MARENSVRCPECNRLGSNDPSINHLCKTCLAKQICVQCGEPAYKYLEQSPYHSFYCQFHYERKLEDLGQEPQHIIRDNYIGGNPFTKTEAPVPDSKHVGLVKEKYGLER